jgi:hypothetical protein
MDAFYMHHQGGLGVEVLELKTRVSLVSGYINSSMMKACGRSCCIESIYNLNTFLGHR